MPDQVHRGFGKHSMLGFINEQRSDIMLYNDLSIENMSRALTQESTLVAEKDIVRVLNAAGRPYAEDIARAYGIEQHFQQFNVSPLAKQRTEIGPLPSIAGFSTLGIAGGIYGYRFVKRKRQSGKDLNTRVK